MSDTRISIIIPTFNEETGISKLLSYLEKHSGESVAEIIIADGGSSDRTVELAEKKGVKVVSCSRKGRAAQMNQGAEAAIGSTLYFLHADTTPPRNFATYIYRAILNGYPCGCFMLQFDDPHPVLKLYSWFTRFPITLFRFGDQSLYVQKELFLETGGFDETLIVMEDQEIVRRLKRENPFEVLDQRVITSARRYKQNGIYRLQLVFTLIVIMYYCGAGQETLVHIYQLFIHQ